MLKSYLLNAASNMTLLVVLLTSVACGGQSSETSNGAKPPKTDIQTAALTGDLEAMKQHIAAGSNLNEKDPFGGSSPLITASLFGHTEVARVLIEAGADINFKNNDGSTPLHVAAFFCRPEIVRMLLDKGADKTVKNTYDATPRESILAPFEDMKPTYDLMGTQLAPLGLKMDYAYMEKTRPVIAEMLQ